MKLAPPPLAPALAALVPGFADAAAVTYEGTLVSDIAENGSSDGFSWLLDDGADVSFWEFRASAQ